MPNLSTYMQQNILKWLLRNTQLPAPPTTVYASLHTADPAQTGANEVVTTAGTGWVGYTRVAVSTSTPVFGAPAASGTLQQSQNGSAITFPNSGNTSGTVTATHLGFWDAASGGNYLGGGALGASQTIQANSAGPSFAANQLTVQQL